MRSRCTRKRENGGGDKNEFLVSCRQLLASVKPADGFPGPANHNFDLSSRPAARPNRRSNLFIGNREAPITRSLLGAGVSTSSLHFHNCVATHPRLPVRSLRAGDLHETRVTNCALLDT